MNAEELERIKTEISDQTKHQEGDWPPVYVVLTDDAIKLVSEVERLQNKVADMHKDLLTVFRYIEWVQGENGEYCPMCHRRIEYGHLNSCRLAKALEALK
jgi:hypothetical protein